MGIYLENLRGATSNTAGSPVNGWSVGKLKDLQGKLNQSRRLWAAVLVPPYWQAPEGVPEVWTRLHEDEILPAIKAEEDRVRLAEERKRSFAAWQVRQSRHEAQFARGNPVMFDFLASDLALARPIMELCDVLWPDEPVFLTRMNELGVTTLGQVLQLSKEEVHLLIRKTIRDDVATSYYYARFAEWLHDQSGLLHPVALKPEDADNHPIPQCIIEHRVYLQELKSGLSAGTDAIVASNLNNLNKRIDELELSVRTANCLQNAHIEYVWQLCEYTEARLLKTKNFGRKSLNESKEILAELGLKLGMEFSEQARSLLSTH
ncbi:hypothetical protein HQ487_03390 [Candidatus Uhrbacteria bacterium]|nr:hypothetical protein [Candidatus Uhrbacteria bacterium]